MTRFSLLRLAAPLCAIAILTSCAGTKVVNQWQTDAGPISPASKLAVIVMMPEELLRQSVEQAVADKINAAGGNAVVSSNISGMRGKLSREKAEPALKAAGVDAAVVVFLTSATKGEKLVRSDYYLKHEGTGMTYDWFAPQFVEVYSVQQGAGYYDQTRQLFLESTYYALPSVEARWTIVTESGNLERQDIANAITGKIISQMKRDGTL